MNKSMGDSPGMSSASSMAMTTSNPMGSAPPIGQPTDSPQQPNKAKPKNTGTRLQHVPDIGGVETAPPRKKRNRNRAKRPPAGSSVTSVVTSIASQMKAPGAPGTSGINVVPNTSGMSTFNHNNNSVTSQQQQPPPPRRVSSQPTRLQQQEQYYARKHQLLKRSLRALVFKNAALCDEVARLHQRIATTEEDAKIIIRRLLYHERLRQRRVSNAIRRQNAREQRLAAQMAAQMANNSNQDLSMSQSQMQLMDDTSSNQSMANSHGCVVMMDTLGSLMVIMSDDSDLIDDCLNKTWMCNVIGPPCTAPDDEWLSKYHGHCTETTKCAQTPSGFALHEQTVNREYLCVALHLMFVTSRISNSKNDNSDGTRSLMQRIRAFRLQYKLAVEPCFRIRSQTKELCERILLTSASNDHDTIVYNVECVYVCVMMQLFNLVDKHLDTALKAANLQVNMTGAMGKRTKFQSFELAQLVLDVKPIDRMSEPVQWPAEYQTGQTPYLCKLDDDTVLDGVQLTDTLEPDDCCDPSSALLQSLVLADCVHKHRVTSSDDPVRKERSRAYLEWLLRYPVNWSVVYSSLILRCRVERDERRRVERALAQVEQLCKDFRNQDIPYDSRSPLTFQTDPLPIWQVEAIQAEVLLSLGCTTEAISIYDRLRLWPELINCYKQINKTEQAEALIRKCLAENDNQPLMYVYLGEITLAEEHYKKAIELSHGGCHQAHKGLGMMWLQRKQYKEAAQHFAASLAVQPLQYMVAYNLGYCHMQLEDWPAAAHAYYQATSLEPASPDAWNNLSAVYLHINTLDAKAKAFRILRQEALRHNYDHWKIWENYLFVGVDLNEWGQVIRAYNRLIDLKKTYVDTAVLNNLSVAVVELKTESPDVPDTQRIYDESLKLFGRLTSIVGNNASVWRSYAGLCAPKTWPDASDDTSRQKYVELLDRAHAAALQGNDMDTDANECVRVLRTYLAIVDADTSIQSDNTRKATIRMSLRQLLARVTKRYEAPGGDGQMTEVVASDGTFDKLKEFLKTIT